MSHSNGIISGSVAQIADVKTVLGESVNTLSGLCKSTKINMWSKYKPVRYNSATPDRSGNWWKSNTQDCGINPYILRSVEDVVNHCNGTANGWTYATPTGGTYPYRLLDFNGYNHYASCPIWLIKISPTTVTNKSVGSFAVNFGSIISSSTNLALEDLNSIKDCYTGVFAKHRTNNTSRTAASTTKIKDGGQSFEVSTYGWGTGTWDVYPFITEISGDDNTYTGIRYSMPNVSSTALTVVTNTTGVYIVGYSVDTSRLVVVNNYRGYAITATVKITNTSSSSVTYSSNTARTRFTNNTYTDAMQVGETEWSLASVTVAANETKTITISGVIIPTTYDGGANLWVNYSRTGETIRDYIYVDNGSPI